MTRTGATIVLLVLAAGCAGLLASKNAPMAPPPRACCSDAACSSSRHEVCRLADGSGTPSAGGSGSSAGSCGGICVIPAAASTSEVYLEVRPASDRVPPAQLGPVQLASGQNQSFVLPAPATVSGAVVEHETDRPVGLAKVRFKLQPLIPDRPMTFETTSSADPAAPGSFSRLLPAGDFSVTLVPPPASGVVKPPNEHPVDDDRPLPLGSLAAQPQSFALSALSELVTFAGVATLARDGKTVPAANVEVWAMDAHSLPARATGLVALAGRALAQSETTDAAGRFTLWLPRLAAGQSAHRVRLQFGPAAGGAPFPSFVDPTTYLVDRTGAQPVDVAGSPLSSPPPVARVDSPVEVSGRVQVQEQGRLVGLAGARVTFRTVDDAPFSFATTVVTGDDGSYDVALFPATYRPLAALPPPDGGASAVPVGDCPPDRDPDQGFTVEAGSATTRDFLCEDAVGLAGETRGLADARVPFVAVEAVRHKDGALADDLHLRTQSDAGGVFALYVPAGDYDLVLTPPASSKLPVTVVPVGTVSQDSASARLVIELSPPFELFGQLFSGDKSHPVAASIDAYTVTGGQSLLVGQSASAEDGSYSLVLPASGR